MPDMMQPAFHTGKERKPAASKNMVSLEKIIPQDFPDTIC